MSSMSDGNRAGQEVVRVSESPHHRGLHVDVGTLNSLLRRHLPHLGTCLSLRHLDTGGGGGGGGPVIGFNNKIYLFTTSGGRRSEKAGGEDRDPDSDPSLPPLVIRICKMSWEPEKVECEVVALRFVADNTSIPVPRVICHDSSGDRVGFRWIIMERMPGDNLAEVWTSLGKELQGGVVRQAVGYLRQIQDITWNTIGSFYLTSVGAQPQQDVPVKKEDITVGKLCDPLSGPFDNIIHWSRYNLGRAINAVENNCKLLELRELLPKAKALLSGLEENGCLLPEIPITTVHGDFSFRNMLVDVDTGAITALLDWEWAGAMPCHIEWINSSFHDRSVAWNHVFQEEANSQQLLTPDTIPGYREHLALAQVWDNLSPWGVGLYNEVRDKQIVHEAKNELTEHLALFNL